MYFSFFSPDVEDHIFLTGDVSEKVTAFVSLGLNDANAPIEQVIEARFPNENFLLKEKAKHDLNELISQGYRKIGVSSDGMHLLIAKNDQGWKLVRSSGFVKLVEVDETLSTVLTNNELTLTPARNVDRKHLDYLCALAEKRTKEIFSGKVSYLRTSVSVCGVSFEIVERENLPEQQRELDKLFNASVEKCCKWIVEIASEHDIDPAGFFIRDNDYIEPFGRITNIKLAKHKDSLKLTDLFSYDVYEEAFNTLI